MGSAVGTAVQRHDVVIIGGGVYGASIAYHLSARRVDCALVEMRGLASGPTGRSSAVVRVHYSMPELAELAIRGLEFFSNARDTLGTGDVGFVRVGVLYGIGTDLAAAFAASGSVLRDRGFPIETLTPDEMRSIVPGFNLDGIAIGLWEPRSGYADPAGTTAALAERARELGATVRVNSRVVELAVQGGRVAGVTMADGTRIAADTVVVAAGPWTKRLVAQVGFELPLASERHAVSVLDAGGSALTVVPCVWSDLPRDYYARPDGDDNVLVAQQSGGTTVADPDVYEGGVSLAETEAVMLRAAPRIPGLESLGIRGGWASLYDVSPDRLHIIDEIPGVDGLYCVAGTSGTGFKLAPAIGEEVARMVTTGTSDLLRPFRLNRTFDASSELHPR